MTPPLETIWHKRLAFRSLRLAIAALAVFSLTAPSLQAAITVDNIKKVNLSAHAYDHDNFAYDDQWFSYDSTFDDSSILASPLEIEASAENSKSKGKVTFSTNGPQSQMVITADVELASPLTIEPIAPAFGPSRGTFNNGGLSGVGNFDLYGDPNVAFSIETSISFSIAAGLVQSSDPSSWRFVTALYKLDEDDVWASENIFNLFIDSLNPHPPVSGTLTAGTYWWFFEAMVDDESTADGKFQLTLGNALDPSAVPEPATLLTWAGLALTGLCYAAHRRWRQPLAA